MPLLWIGLSLGPPIQAQQQIGGRVVDAATRRPIAAAQVSIARTGSGGLTGVDGRFLLEVVGSEPIRIEVVHIGYRTWVGAAEPGTLDLAIELEPTALQLDAVVVTGTVGEQRVKTLGNAVARVDATAVKEASALASVESLLTGTVSGLNVTAGGGEVGSGANIRIRGASSISLSSQPLLYIDGVRVNGDNADNGGGVIGVGVDWKVPPSRLNDINPEDIESIEVLKGPSASTLYGTEASNGIINVITKRGDRGETRFTLTVKQGGNWLPDPESYFPDTYFTCQGTSGTCEAGEVTAFNVLKEDRIRNGNTWFDTGHMQGYAGSISGGTDRVRYYVSADWDRDEGFVEYNWQNQLRGRANLNWTPTGALDVNFGLGSTWSELRAASANQPVTTSIYWACWRGCEAGSGDPSAVDGPTRGYLGPRPEEYVDSVIGLQNLNRTTLTVNATHRPTGWLTHRLVMGADWTNTNNSELDRPTGRNPLGGKETQRQTAEFLTFDYWASTRVAATPELDFTTTVGAQYHQKQFDWVYARGRGFASPALETVTAGALQEASEDFVQNKTFGTYVQEQVGWRDLLFATFALRGDDNSAFGRNFDFVLYPKVSASWIVTGHARLADVQWLTDLRLRGAWGKAGQQPDVLAALRTYRPAVGPNGSPALRPDGVGNPDLEPEVGEEVEVGFDVALFQDRVGMELSYYDQARRQALVQIPVRPSTGFTGSRFENLGEVRNSGLELGVSAEVVRQERWELALGLNAALNDNELVSLGGLPPTTLRPGQYLVEGYPLGSLFAKRVVSADLEGAGATATVSNVMCEGGDVLEGTLGLHPQGLSAGGAAPVPCAEAPLVFRGEPVPTRDLSVTIRLGLPGAVRLFAQVDYQGGFHMVNGTALQAHALWAVSEQSQRRDDPLFVAYQRLPLPDGLGGLSIMDSSFAKLRRVSVSWALPERLVRGIGARGLSLTAAAHNLWTIWQATDDIFGYPVPEPEARITGGVGEPGGLAAYYQEGWPQARRFTLTARVDF